MPYSDSFFFSYGVDDGARTHDNRNHNPGLYQLSYDHHIKPISLRSLYDTPPRLVLQRYK